MFPLNAIAFLGISMFQWGQYSAHAVDAILTCSAVAYFAGAFLRAMLARRSEAGAKLTVRSFAAGYYASVTIAAVLSVAVLCRRLGGSRLELALLIEGEMLTLAGFVFEESYLRSLGASVFVVPMLLLFDDAIGSSEKIAIAGISLRDWTPVGSLAVALFYLNRALSPRRSTLYGYGASALAAVLLMANLPDYLLGLGWIAFAALLFELGAATDSIEFRLQAYVIGTAGGGFLLIGHAAGLFGSPDPRPELTLALAGLLLWGAVVQLRLGTRLACGESIAVSMLASAFAAAVVATLIWYAAPGPLVAVGWMLLGLALIESGFLTDWAALRAEGYAVLALACGRLFLANLTIGGETIGISHRLLTVTPVIAALYYLYDRLGRTASLERWERAVRRASLWTGALLIVILMRFELGRVMAVDGWAGLMLVLLIIGRRRNDLDLRVQSYLAAILCFARSWSSNFYIPGSFGGREARLITGAIVIGVLYACVFVAPRQSETAPAPSRLERWELRIESYAREALPIIATLLLALLLYYEVSGTMLTVAWAVAGGVIIAAGFPLRERYLRLSGLALLAVCIFKVFAYDLSQLQALPRILSFIVLGALLLGVSLAYTRLRGRLDRYL